MRDTDWCFVNEAEDAHIAYDLSIEKYIGIFDICVTFSNIVKGKELTKDYKALDLSGIMKTIKSKEKQVVQTIPELSLKL